MKTKDKVKKSGSWTGEKPGGRGDRQSDRLWKQTWPLSFWAKRRISAVVLSTNCRDPSSPAAPQD